MIVNRQVTFFVNEFAKEVEEENAAIFAGAGLSIPAGYVNWRQLLKPLADELNLDINREYDLVTLAQYYCNENQGNRNRINQLIMGEFSQNTTVTENHKILSRLPIHTYWTTNYDKLIEKSLEQEGKVPDVKYTINQLATTKPDRDAIVYKMHGDVDHPNDAVILKDDYESYFLKMQPFITALSGDLVSKTFLFIGLSFSDPNLDYILSRIRSTYDNNQRRHYCLLKKIEHEDDESDEEFEYRQRKQDLFINDLKRFNITTIVLESYEQITEILQLIENKLRRKTVFISGSAHEYNHWSSEESQNFVHLLSKELTKQKLNIVSGFGLGVGSFVISGALEEIYMHQGKINNNQLILRPFPQSVPGNQSLRNLWQEYRQDMLSRSGISIFIYGNKIQDGKTVIANGVLSEFEIAVQNGNVIVPVGATGYAAKEIWEKVNTDFDKYFPNSDQQLVDQFNQLNNENLSYEDIVKEIINFVNLLT
ncbi:SIR2 family protein [Alteribacillus sp. YIM 98480]|uniref:SIR2 family protein n=1 Tax=Alteribacillus sp. YIM 98480 TaxID=2606599 RepID=UPI00131C92C3|nr:SIR2 family protein [Alteribacillus sp. YIM 98480]